MNQSAQWLAFEQVFSAPRLSTYLNLAQQDVGHAMALYQLNIDDSARMLKLLHVIEVGHRNVADQVLRQKYGSRWFESEALPFSVAQKKMIHHALESSSEDVLTRLTFGFWVSLYGPSFEEVWRHDLRHVFEHGHGIVRKDVSKRLTSLRYLRNRVAHHECILSSNQSSYERMLFELMEWISPEIALWMRESFF